MTSHEKKKFRVITNENFENDIGFKEKQSYHTNPLREKLIKYIEKESASKFSVDDLLKW